MNRIIFFLYLALIGNIVIIALPVKEKIEEKNEEIHKDGNATEDDWELSLEYGRYLKEVVQALESDPEFRKKLETANVEDIKSGKISRELHFVDHKVRSKLDELKRRELERLRHLAVQEHEKKSGVDRTKLKIPIHVDHKNPTRFEPEDLKKLILQLNKDLEEVEKKRKSDFKQYELQKEYEYKHKMAELPEDQKKDLVKQHEEELTKHKEHPKLHHPGSKQQFEEVWEEQDHMKSEDFDPRTFFHLHDLDGNGYWDENEVKALFQKELDKMYDPNAPEDDLMERYEEMERMREHVFGETDANNDNLISFDEFLQQTKKSDFERDEGWQGLDEQELFSQNEYQAYENQRQREIQQLIEQGAIPPPPGYHGLNPPQPMHMGSPQEISGHPNQGMQQGHYGLPHQGYQGATQDNQGAPQGYQAMPQGYQVPPHGYQVSPQGYQEAPPQGYQAPPQGYQAASPQGYQAPHQGYQAPHQGYQAPPQGYQAPPQGYQAPPQEYQAPPQGYQAQPQAYQAPPQGQGIQPQAIVQPNYGANPQAIAGQPQNVPQQPQGLEAQKPLPPIPPVPQAHALPNTQPQPIPQGVALNQGQHHPPQVQHNVKNPNIGDPSGSPSGGVVLQNPREDLNRQPDMKPIDNHLPGTQ